jgi:hypothetical protein
MDEFLKSKGFIQISENDVPIGVPVSRRTLKNFPLIVTNKWENKNKKLFVRVWDNGFCTIVSKGVNNFYEYVSHNKGIKLIDEVINDKKPQLRS